MLVQVRESYQWEEIWSFRATLKLLWRQKRSIDMQRPARPLWSSLPVCSRPIDLCRYTKGNASLINALDRVKAITRSTTLSTHVHTPPNYRSHSCTRIKEHRLCSDPWRDWKPSSSELLRSSKNRIKPQPDRARAPSEWISSFVIITLILYNGCCTVLYMLRTGIKAEHFKGNHYFHLNAVLTSIQYDQLKISWT